MTQDLQSELRAGLSAILSATDHNGVQEAARRHPILISGTAVEVLIGIAKKQDRIDARNSVLMISWFLANGAEEFATQMRAKYDEPRVRELEQAIFRHKDEIVLLARESNHSEWPKFSNDLAHSYRHRAFGDRAENIDRAIACYQNVLGVISLASNPHEWGKTCNALGITYCQRLRGDRSDNLERAISYFESALTARTRDVDPHGWAGTLTNLGNAYSNRVDGNQVDNLERSIACFKDALTVLTHDVDPHSWASIRNNLGTAYINRVGGDPAENVEFAIACFDDALTVRNRENDVRGWTETVSNLGAAYCARLLGDRAENLEQAIGYYEGALATRARDGDLHRWASTCNDLGAAYYERLRGDRAENLERAIACYRDALTVRTRESDASGWASTTRALGKSYLHRVNGDQSENRELAIACLEDARTIHTDGKSARDWAESCYRLGNAYCKRLSRDPASNLKRAIACFEDALSVITRDSDAREWAKICNSLGIAYNTKRDGNLTENVERAIAYFKEALAVLERDVDPYSWAQISRNLGNAYRHRRRGDRAENQERAISYYEGALKVLTRGAYANDWATTLAGLGNTYGERLRGNQSENVERAIACYEDALGVLTPDNSERDWAQTCTNLGTAYSRQLGVDRAGNQERAIFWYVNALTVRTRDRDKHGWAQIMHNLGTAYHQRLTGEGSDNLELSIAYYKDALTVRARESDEFGWANTSIDLAHVYCNWERGDRTQNLERAIALYREVAGPAAALFSAVERLKQCDGEARALLLLGRDRWPEAKVPLNRAFELFSDPRNEAITREARLGLLAALGHIGRWSALVSISQNEPNEALEALEGCRAVGMREALVVDTLLSKDISDSLRSEIRKARREIDTLLAEASLPTGDRLARSFSVITAELREAKAAFSKGLAEAGCEPTAPLKAHEILAAIPAGTNLIVPVATEFGGFVFVVPGGTTKLERHHVVELPGLTSAALREHVREHIDGIETMKFCLRAAASLTEQERDVRKVDAFMAMNVVRHWIGESVLGPALSRLSAIDPTAVPQRDGRPPVELLIMPTGEFALLPLHAAWCAHNGERRDVIDDYCATYTPNMYALQVAQIRRKGQSADPRRLLALVNPTRDLPYCEGIELPMLSRSFAGNQNTILVGSQASKAALKELAAGCSNLHLACHGRFDWSDPFSSGLQLSRGESLTISDIVAGLDLRACRLVVLSGCETGVSDVMHMPEEAVGQVSAFQHAGASCVAASLWTVADASSALFVNQFYEQHLSNGLTPAQAARAAALWLRDLDAEAYCGCVSSIVAQGRPALVQRDFPSVPEDDAARTSPDPTHGLGDKPFASPFFWAAFALWGG